MFHLVLVFEQKKIVVNFARTLLILRLVFLQILTFGMFISIKKWQCLIDFIAIPWEVSKSSMSGS